MYPMWYNHRPNLIAVDTHNEQTTRALPRYTILVIMHIMVYQHLSRPCVSGVIRDEKKIKIKKSPKISVPQNCELTGYVVLVKLLQ